VALIAVATGACSAETGEPEQSVHSPVVYGHDSRVAPTALESQAAQGVLAKSTLALVPEDFTLQGSDSLTVSTQPVGEVFGLCASELGVELPAAAVCTGVAVAANVVATAAHCVADQEDCDRLVLIRGFLWDSWQPNVPAEHVFKCRRILFRRYHDCSDADLALIEISPPMDAFAELAERSPKFGEKVIACGASFGAPIRCDPEAIVSGATPSAVTLAADLAIGASGGPVLDTTGRLVGVVSGGADDLSWGATCAVEATRTDHGIEKAESADSIRTALAVSRASTDTRDPPGNGSGVCTVPAESVPGCSVWSTSSAPDWWPELIALVAVTRFARRRSGATGVARAFSALHGTRVATC